MGIELGSVGSAMGGIATAVGRGVSGLGRIGTEASAAVSAPASGLARMDSGPAFEAAPSLGSLGEFAPAGLSIMPDVGGVVGSISELKASAPVNIFGAGMIAPAETIINEGPASLENSMKIQSNTLDLLGEIRFAPQAESEVGLPFKSEVPPVFQEAFAQTLDPDQNELATEPKVIEPLGEVIAIAEPKSVPGWEAVLPEVKPIVMPAGSPAPLEVRAVKMEPNVQSANQVVTQTEQAILPATKQEEAVAQEAEEVVEQQEVKKSQEIGEEEIIKEEKNIVKDEEAAAQRAADITAVTKTAAIAARLLGLKKIPGALMEKLMPKEYAGVRGEVVKEKGQDGSYLELKEEIGQSGEFESETEARESALKIAEEKKPGKWSKDGIRLTVKDVARIFRNRIIKSVPIHTEVVKRVVKKRIIAPQAAFISAAPPKEVQTESTLKDFPQLEEVFPKAA